jgi:hypothetical protein
MLIPSVRVMLSANVSGDAKARHHIRHRARHGLRGGVASPLQHFAPVVPCRRPRRPRRSRASHAAHAPRQRLTQACAPGRPDGLRGVEHPAEPAGTLDASSLQQPPTSSFRQQHIPPSCSARWRTTAIVISCGTRPQQTNAVPTLLQPARESEPMPLLSNHSSPANSSSSMLLISCLTLCYGISHGSTGYNDSCLLVRPWRCRRGMRCILRDSQRME